MARSVDDGDDGGPADLAAPARPARSGAPARDAAWREFEFAGGVHLTGSVLWCDADRRQDLTFLSHAHGDPIGKNRRTLATEATVRLLTRGTGRVDVLTSPFGRSFALGPLELELHPAGHVLGSAQLLVRREGRRVVYTSDFNLRGTATVERAAPVPCDVLALPATYGLPLYRFPPREEVLEGIRRFVDDALCDRATPVLIANQLGTSQELMHALGHAGYRLRVHRSIHDVAKVYGDLGVELPNARRFQGAPARDELVIFPPILRTHASIRELKRARVALVTGRAVEEAHVFRCRVDAAFPLSDTADHADLHAMVAGSGAREVHLMGPHAEAFAEELRARGLKVYTLAPPTQLELF